ncbi:tyrosine-type recombinase/integrase [Pectobacterium brasiliense]|uniref:tyrosine-type recombinase/integrase n=1 Tax=Pectobacterium brasiliense TaxID=180957 RepID=UPI0032EAAEBF
MLTTHKAQHYPFLKADEIPAFIQAVESYTGSVLVQIAAKLLMLTGVRTIELRAAEWSEFDLGHAIWKIPAERMKKAAFSPCPLGHTSAIFVKSVTNHQRQL